MPRVAQLQVTVDPTFWHTLPSLRTSDGPDVVYRCPPVSQHPPASQVVTIDGPAGAGLGAIADGAGVAGANRRAFSSRYARSASDWTAPLRVEVFQPEGLCVRVFSEPHVP